MWPCVSNWYSTPPVPHTIQFSFLFNKGTVGEKWRSLTPSRMSLMLPNQQCKSTEGNSPSGFIISWAPSKLLRAKKGKEEYLYSAIYTTHSLKASDMDHTVLTADYTMLPLLYKCSPDGATPNGDIRRPTSLLLIYWPRRDERLSWLGWLPYSGRFTHISGHPSSIGRVQDRESLPAKDWPSIAVPCSQDALLSLVRLSKPSILKFLT